MITTTLPQLSAAQRSQHDRLAQLLNPAIPATIDREALIGSTEPISRQQAQQFCDYLDTQFPVERQALMAGMVHPNFTDQPINYITGKPLNDDRLWVIGISCTVAAMAAYRGCYPLYKNGEISRETFREIVGASWTYNSAKAFETSRRECETELLTLLKPCLADVLPSFGKVVIETVKNTPAKDQQSFPEEVINRLKRTLGIVETVLKFPDAERPIEVLLREHGCSPTVCAWLKAYQSERPDIGPESFLSSLQAPLESIQSALGGSTLAYDLARAYSKEAYQEVADRLREAGLVVDESLLNILAHARKNTGHGSLGKLLMLFVNERAMAPAEFSSLSQHLWSDMTATNNETGESRLVTPLGKMDLQGFRGDLPGIPGYKWMLSEGLAVFHGPDGKDLIARDIKDFKNPPAGALYASSYFALQHQVGNACAHVQAAALGIAGESCEVSARNLQDFMNDGSSQPLVAF